MPSSYQNKQLAWYDRNIISVVLKYSALGVAPHASTIRATYTVPARRKAFVSDAHVDMYRSAVAAPVGKVAASIYRSVAASNYIFVRITTANNVVGDLGQDTVGQSVICDAGDLIEITTQDAGTGGTVDYITTTMAVEYDA